jgi:hypothetical protein
MSMLVKKVNTGEKKKQKNRKLFIYLFFRLILPLVSVEAFLREILWLP